MPSSWRKLAIAGTVGVVVAMAFSAPADACSLRLKTRPIATCASANTAQIEWHVVNGAKKNISITGFQGIHGIATGQMGGGAEWSGTQIVARGEVKAHINIHIRNESSFTSYFDMSKFDWSKCAGAGGGQSGGGSDCKDKCGTCGHGQPCNPPCGGSQPCNPPCEGSQTCTHGPADSGSSDTPSEPAGTATATSTSSKAATGKGGGSSAASDSSSLPVTGANVALMTAGALVLIGAGVALFLAARRRRVSFTV